MKTLVTCARAVVSGKTVTDFSFVIDGERIAESGTDFPRLPSSEMSVRDYGPEVVVIPGLVNGHSHAYQILLRGWADDLPFSTWRSEALYRVIPSLTAEEIYWVFTAAFSEMLASGITTVAEFFYLNGSGNARAEAAIAAARDCGIRLVLARTWMDAPEAPEAFRESIPLAAQRTAELLEGFPAANVCVAPHSLHAASQDMIVAAHAFAVDRDCAMHIHLAEAPYEAAQVRERFGTTPLRLLDRWGVLDERTVAIHAIYLDDEERDMLARAGARVVHNPSTNQYLGDGICDVAGLLRRNVCVGLGTDADVKPSIVEEMRGAAFLQKLAALDGSALGARAAFDMGTMLGARAIGISSGDFQPGLFADYTVLDASAIDPWSPEINAIVYRGESSWVRETHVGGRPVYNGSRSARARDAAAYLGALAPRLLLGDRENR